jgi:putative nucleotidyltransferase with HDIG domain
MTTPRSALSDAGRLYVAAVCAAGIAVVLHSLLTVTHGKIGYQWFVLAGLTLLSGSFTIRIPTIPARLSVSETFVFASAILFGPAAATIIVVLDSLVISFWLKKSSRRPSRVLFNMAAPAIAIWAATHVFFLRANVPPLSQAPQPILSLVVPLLILATLYFLLNSLLIAGAVGFEKRVSPFTIWRENFLWLSLNYFSGASVAALLLPYLQQDDHRAFLRVAGILLPLLLISYLTFKTALGRVEDANRHLTELNRLYLSTIETLAMAIDAKDQITHGHIRRVQHYAVGLAGRMGITETKQLKAIEAASLLHDMGKLAVPEYILNKPGKLTPAEFEKMKLHASVGADILSAIDFPYPVVPIVRHHHENWDGTGYPDGLRGSDIPIGARILSVVDCFDALTSDRPYRPRLADADAIAILQQRRGVMYDPLVVDTFLASYTELAPTDEPGDSHSLPALISDTPLPEVTIDGPRALDDIASSSEEMVVLFDLVRSLASVVSATELTELIASHVRRIIPASSWVLYVYHVNTDELVAVHATGEHSSHFTGVRIRRGERLTGWVAANKQTILNSDPVLDLGEISRGLRPRLRSCLSTPVLHDDSLVGVLSLYSIEPQAFSENHRRVSELVGRQIAPFLRTQRRQEDTAKGLLRNVSESTTHAEPTESGHLSIALIDVTPSLAKGVPPEAALSRLAVVVKGALRGADVLFHYAQGELVALLGGTTSESAAQIVRRIAERLQKDTSDSNLLSIRIGIASTPIDGSSIENLISAAKMRRESLDKYSGRRPSIH